MAYSPPKFLLPAHHAPIYLVPTHRLWPLSSQKVSRPSGPPDIEENGRRYQGFWRSFYPYPCDEPEKQRLFMYHEIFLYVRDGRLHGRPLPRTRGGDCRRILDLGTGPGTWAISIAELYPDTEVLGMDLASIQPLTVPRNLRFLAPFDYESCWFEKSYDYVHLRCALGSVRSWTRLYHSIFQRLRPDGVFEQVEIDLQPRWDNGRDLPQEHPLQRWYTILRNASIRAGRSIGWRQDIGQLLLNQGFVDVQTEEIRLPITVRPPHYSSRSQYLSDRYTAALKESVEAFSLGPLTQDLGWPVSKARGILDGVVKLLEGSDEHLYNNMHIVTAKRPSEN